jgi:hypothetical protein
MPEFNHPLAELRRQLFDGTAALRMLAKSFYPLPDGLDGSFGCIKAFRS